MLIDNLTKIMIAANPPSARKEYPIRVAPGAPILVEAMNVAMKAAINAAK